MLLYFSVVSPPKSPAPELADQPLQALSTSSSVEIVSEPPPDTDFGHMTELVQERIASLGLKPGMIIQSDSDWVEPWGEGGGGADRDILCYHDTIIISRLTQPAQSWQSVTPL